MALTFAELTNVAPLTGLMVRTAEGKMGVAALAASAVQHADGKTAEQKITGIIVDIAAVNAALGTQGTDLSTLQTSLSTLETTLNDFLTGDPNGGEIDLLKELVAEITANRSSIEAITSSKVAKADIVDNLTTTDAAKVLSAAQGVALKGLLDALSATINDGLAAVHSHGNKAILDALSVGVDGDKAGKLLYGGDMIGDSRLDAKVITALPENNVWPADVKPSGILFYHVVI